jgi:hypothetical protein
MASSEWEGLLFATRYSLLTIRPSHCRFNYP